MSRRRRRPPHPGQLELTLVLDQLVPTWADHLLAEGFSASTVRARTFIVRHALRHLPGQPTREDLEHFIADRRRQGVSQGHLRNTTYALRSFLRFARPAARDLLLTPPRAPRTTRQPPPPDHTARLIVQSSVHPRSAALVAVLVDTGARVHELAHLTRSAIVPTPGGGRALLLQGKAGPRTGPRPRLVALSPAAATVLDTWARRAPPGQPLFPGDDAIRSVLRGLCTAAGIPTITPHQLRHFYTTQALGAGAPVKAVSAILGHASAATTLDVYTHLTGPDLQDTQARFSPFAHIAATGFPQPLHPHRRFQQGRSPPTPQPDDYEEEGGTSVPGNT